MLKQNAVNSSVKMWEQIGFWAFKFILVNPKLTVTMIVVTVLLKRLNEETLNS